MTAFFEVLKFRGAFMYKYDVIDNRYVEDLKFSSVGKGNLFKSFFDQCLISKNADNDSIISANSDLLGFSYKSWKNSETRVLINFADLDKISVISNKKIIDYSDFYCSKNTVSCFYYACKIQHKKAALTALNRYILGGDGTNISNNLGLLGFKKPEFDFSHGYSSQINHCFVYRNIKDFLKFFSEDLDACKQLLMSCYDKGYRSFSDLYVAFNTTENKIFLHEQYLLKDQLLVQEAKRFIEQNFKDY